MSGDILIAGQALAVASVAMAAICARLAFSAARQGSGLLSGAFFGLALVNAANLGRLLPALVAP